MDYDISTSKADAIANPREGKVATEAIVRLVPCRCRCLAARTPMSGADPQRHAAEGVAATVARMQEAHDKEKRANRDNVWLERLANSSAVERLDSYRPLVFVIRIVDERFLDELYSEVIAENAGPPKVSSQDQATNVARKRENEAYHSFPTNPSSSLTSFSLLAPLAPLPILACNSRILALVVKPLPSSTFFPRQSLWNPC